MGSLVETVTETKIKESIDIEGPGNSIMSVVPRGDGVHIMIGGDYASRKRSYFSRYNLTKLIEALTEVRDAL